MRLDSACRPSLFPRCLANVAVAIAPPSIPVVSLM